MYLAIDIGGTKTLLAVFNTDGRVVFEHKIKTNKSYSGFMADIQSVLKNELKDYEFSYCCCAAPGLVDHKTGVVSNFGNLAWHNAAIKDDLRKALGHVPILVENDAKAAGLSEALIVHDKYKKVLYLTISTGIGGGVIINGKIDPIFIDTEPGHMVLEHDGKLQKWEDFASGRALKERFGKLASEIDDPGIWQTYARDLSTPIEQLLAVVQPDVVIIGGGVGAHFDKFAVPLIANLKKLEDALIKIPPIIKAQRPEEAVIYGCYELIKQKI